jgi:hypothetical protein
LSSINRPAKTTHGSFTAAGRKRSTSTTLPGETAIFSAATPRRIKSSRTWTVKASTCAQRDKAARYSGKALGVPTWADSSGFVMDRMNRWLGRTTM